LERFAHRAKEFVQRLAACRIRANASRKRANATRSREVPTPRREMAKFFGEIAESVRPAHTSKQSPKSAE
jgi:hypothetical protein